jgi:hypothetical protein
MATFEELQNRASILVRDPSRTEDISFADIINQGVAEIAGGMQSSLGSWITPPLPELLTIGIVATATDSAYVSMPDDFQRTLQFAVKASGQEVGISNSFIEFAETYPLLNKSGIISEVIEHGGNIYYQGIPTVSEVLTVHYHRMPVAMVRDSDVPDGIPLHLQIPLLVNYAAWKAHEFIEDGMEGETPNTQKFMTFFMAALRTLELSIPDYTRPLLLR